MVAGVRPIMRWASSPTACTSPSRVSTATTEGSDTTMPSLRTYTSVLAVPRSIARSRPAEAGHAASGAAPIAIRACRGKRAGG